MDNLKQAFYEPVFELAYMKRKGNTFQDFFSEIMEKAHPRDFQRIRPWGSAGDKKNDGYLKSQRILFQVYAPNEAKSANTIKKIKEDFKGALPYWRQYFGTWVFVHNSRDGLAPGITKVLLALGKKHKQIKLDHWGFEELRRKVFELKDEDIVSLLGLAPGMSDLANLQFEDLEVVLLAIAQDNPKPGKKIRPVPAGKLAANCLSQSVETLLKAGMTKADLVKRFFDRWHDANLGDRVAERFRRKYVELRRKKLLPENIFQELLAFAGGADRGSPSHEAAVLAVLAHLFEECEIFEEPPKRVRA